MPDEIDELVDWQLTHRPAEPAHSQACGACHSVWFGEPVCPWCGRDAA